MASFQTAPCIHVAYNFHNPPSKATLSHSDSFADSEAIFIPMQVMPTSELEQYLPSTKQQSEVCFSHIQASDTFLSTFQDLHVNGYFQDVPKYALGLSSEFDKQKRCQISTHVLFHYFIKVNYDNDDGRYQKQITDFNIFVWNFFGRFLGCFCVDVCFIKAPNVFAPYVVRH